MQTLCKDEETNRQRRCKNDENTMHILGRYDAKTMKKRCKDGEKTMNIIGNDEAKTMQSRCKDYAQKRKVL